MTEGTGTKNLAGWMTARPETTEKDPDQLTQSKQQHCLQIHTYRTCAT